MFPEQLRPIIDNKHYGSTVYEPIHHTVPGYFQKEELRTLAWPG